jgi:outer membrane protein OmpA-like peptidoglycan-associated protein
MMRTKIGLGILCIGVVALGLWTQFVTLPQIETRIRGAAEAVVATAIHGLKVQVSGRDIDLSGLADSDAELAQVMRGLRDIVGQSTVQKQSIEVLTTAMPYVFILGKAGDLTISGSVPSEAARLRLRSIFGDQVDGLTLASGAPKDWEGLIAAGMTALKPMADGAIQLEGDLMILRGNVASPQDAKLITDSLATMKTPVINGIRVLDDGTPTKYGLNYQRIGGTSIRGKLPKGLSVALMQKALGVPKIKGDVKIAMAGDAGEADYLTAWAGILDQLESLTSSVNGADRKVLAKLIPGADAARVKAALETDGFVAQITEQPKPVAEGDTRNNPDTGAPEVFNGGAWTMVEPVIAEPIIAAPTVVEPVVIEPPDAALCQVTTDAILAQTNVVFLPNSDQLDANGDGVVAELVKGMLPCATGALRAEIGGHTDTSGDPNQNLILSQLRADRVRAALISAGLPEVMLTAKGYGSAQPISENESAEGRAQNRRTAITWSQ